MSLRRFASLAFFPLCASLAFACGQHVVAESSGNTTGSGGSAGGVGSGGASVTSASSTSATSTSAQSSSSSGAIVDAGPDVDEGMPSTTYPAFAIDPPQVETYQGPVLAAPKIVPVFFAGYDATLQMSLVDYETKLGPSTFWTALAEYGVGPATTAPPVVLTEMAPATIDDTAIAGWLAGKLDADDPAWPADDDNTVYVLHYPSSTSISLQGSMSCQGFEGYHSNTQLDDAHGGAFAAYAVIPDCGATPQMSELDGLTTTIAHELAEASTDPYVQNQPAYAQADEFHAEWMRLGFGGEVGDMCTGFSSSYTTFPDLPYAVQRIWGNKAAKAGHDWCQPSLPGEVFFNAMPVLPDKVVWVWQTYMQSFIVKGVMLAAGQEKTIEVDLYSDGPTSGPWTVTATDTTSFNSAAKYLDLTLDHDSGVNGQKLHLTIKVNQAGPHGYESFELRSTLGSLAHEWFGIVAPK